MTKIFLPFRGEFGHLLMWHAPFVNSHEGDKVVCCEWGQEALFESSSYYFVGSRPEDREKTERTHENDTPLFNRIRGSLRRRFPNAEFVDPLGPNQPGPKKYIRYQPKKRFGINCDIVVCPRRRVVAAGRNWSGWPEVVARLVDLGYSVFAAGSAEASFDVPCLRAWEFRRSLDATIESILNSKLVVCTDSGLAHLSVQCGKPILMITYRGQPGPGSDWVVRWHRYKEENHLNSAIHEVRGWEDIESVIKNTVELIG